VKSSRTSWKHNGKTEESSEHRDSRVIDREAQQVMSREMEQFSLTSKYCFHRADSIVTMRLSFSVSKIQQRVFSFFSIAPSDNEFHSSPDLNDRHHTLSSSANNDKVRNMK
jgi:hypothetical protein